MLWPHQSIAHDAGLPLDRPSATEFALGYNVSSKAGLDAVMQAAADAGGAMVKPAQDAFWGGYAGYFQDPDGYLLWEVVWNPQLQLVARFRVAIIPFAAGLGAGQAGAPSAGGGLQATERA